MLGLTNTTGRKKSANTRPDIFINQRICAISLALLILFTPDLASAQQKVTPSQVYQEVETVRVILNQLHAANLTEPTTTTRYESLPPRKPRHVFQKARELYAKVQTLRFLNGLPTKELPPTPAKQVSPAEVLRFVSVIRSEITELTVPFKTELKDEQAALAEGKSPTDVYRALAAAGAAVDGLGIPNTVPNDVQQVAQTILIAVEGIRRQKGIYETVTPVTTVSATSPAKVYERGIELMSRLKAISDAENGLSVPGGIVLMDLPSGKITPAHVIDLLNNVLADLSALKVSAGLVEPIQLAPLVGGQSPADVHNTLSTALQALAVL